jgi:methylated-DNA-[protein]-cysteine S-methyltransferase
MRETIMSTQYPLQIASFATDLGWMAVLGAGPTIKQLVFGYPSRAAAIGALDPALVAKASAADAWPELVARLTAYAAGDRVDFADVPLDLDHLSPFQRRVIKHCRAIGYGQTRSYAALANASGSARAARAVGNTMASNRFPIVVPCHRVVHADGRLGHYSAPDGPHMKARLLALEQSPSAPTARGQKGNRPRRAVLART